jgi:cytochrome c-type biogenesis protein CcmH/NrfF
VIHRGLLARRLLVVVALALPAVALPAAVAAAAPQDVANSISQEVMSPFCPGVTLHDCPSDNAVALRAKLAEFAARGWSKARILGWFRTQYGPDRGAGLLTWLLPAMALLAGAALAVILARRWTRARQSEAHLSVEPMPPELRARLDAELARMRAQ